MRVLVILIAMIWLAAPALAEKRIALVIGNGDYRIDRWKLANPTRDADLMAQKLRAVGFEVHTVKNATRAQMTTAFNEHGDRLKEAGEDAVGFLYFAGHGVQSEGLNYLAPVEMVAYNEADVWDQAPRLGLAIRHLKRAGNDTNFIVLDACRDNPLPSASRSVGGGLAALQRSRGMLIAYATKPGATADDGEGLNNSPFTDELARLITRKGLSAESLFRNVATNVEFRTDNRQQPWYESGLRGSQDFCFAGCNSGNDEASAFSLALASGELARLIEFRDRYPNSQHRSLIDREIAALESAAPKASPPPAMFLTAAPDKPEWANGITGIPLELSDACQAGDPEACNGLGLYYESGSPDVQQNTRLARVLFTDACADGFEIACNNSRRMDGETAVTNQPQRTGSNANETMSPVRSESFKEFSKHFPDGSRSPGWLGVSISTLNLDLAQAIGFDGVGALVTETTKGSPAQLYGVIQGDVIYIANDQSIQDAESLTDLIASLEAGDRVKLSIFREPDYIELTVTLAQRPD